MPNPITKRFWHFRPLLTETLPYELPVVLSNDRFYFHRCRVADASISSLLKTVFEPVGRPKPTIPYNYTIRKDDRRTTVLSLIHPLTQLEWCQFYSQYPSSILAHCARSEFSLRRPTSIAAVYASNLGKDENGAQKAGSVHLVTPGGELEPDRLVSFFAYKKFNLLSKFHESREFIRLEKRFPLLRHLDISKCFYSIYTHTIAWAIKGKKFTKENVKAHSFESRFDAIMQRANYNETNGIVVGPELSRIFAEIILQDVDVQVQNALNNKGLSEGLDYSIRRYVDDYSIFANETKTLNSIEDTIKKVLVDYKLFLNESKIVNYDRPFISELSLGRSEIRVKLNAIRQIFLGGSWKDGKPLPDTERQSLFRLVDDLRGIVKRRSAVFCSVSGLVMSELKSLVSVLNIGPTTANHDRIRNWILVARTLVDCAMYLTAVDLRVRTTYNLCQFLDALFSKGKSIPPADFELIEHTAIEELVAIVKAATVRKGDDSLDDSIELFNILICGTHFLGSQFYRNDQIGRVFERVLCSKLSYFKFISLKHCFLHDPNFFAEGLKKLNANAEARLAVREEVLSQSELFHLFCDFISSPDVDEKRKAILFKSVYGGKHTPAEVSTLGRYIGFTDWTGMSIKHILKRKELKPVYAML